MSLGSMISKARLEARLSVEDLSASTNIRVPLLREIEANNFANCGGETYARGHIRNIAQRLGVDPQIFLTAFEDEHMQVDRSMQDMLVETSAMKQPDEVRKVSWKVLATISVASLGIAGLVQIIVSNTSSPNVPAPIAIASSTAVATTTATPKATPSEEATVSTGTGVEVVITAARAKSWLFVSDASGRTLFSGQISPGITKTFTSDGLLNFKIGNAGGVDLVVNGKKVDSIGADGEVVSVSYGLDS
ncbi:Cro/C1-type helix-turn-helix domain [Candidatus Nanopelagicaceae bacterium]